MNNKVWILSYKHKHSYIVNFLYESEIHSQNISFTHQDVNFYTHLKKYIVLLHQKKYSFDIYFILFLT
jgi:hypothetical protein